MQRTLIGTDQSVGPGHSSEPQVIRGKPVFDPRGGQAPNNDADVKTLFPRILHHGWTGKETTFGGRFDRRFLRRSRLLQLDRRKGDRTDRKGADELAAFNHLEFDLGGNCSESKDQK